MRRRARPAAAPGILRRPAAAGAAAGEARHRAPRRRPAEEGGEARGEEERVTPEEALQKYQRGEVVEGVSIAPGGIQKGDVIVAHQGSYYQQKASFAVQVEKEELEAGERELCGILTGTESEPLLRYGSSCKPCRVQVHLCPRGCSQLRENPNLLHTRSLKKLLPETAKTWEGNLLEEGETGLLQAEAEEWRKRKEEERKDKRRRSDSSSPSQKRKRKRKRR